MKRITEIICAMALTTAIAHSQTSTSPAASSATATSGTSESTGTITEFVPGSTIVLNTGTGEPVHYKFARSVTYVNAKGKEVNASKMKKDRKVRVHYMKEGNDMLVDKVTVVKD
jgi:hypothetical protein